MIFHHSRFNRFSTGGKCRQIVAKPKVVNIGLYHPELEKVEHECALEHERSNTERATLSKYYETHLPSVNWVDIEGVE